MNQNPNAAPRGLNNGKEMSMVHRPAWLLALLLASPLAFAQNAPPAPGINRNPAYREQLPPNPVPPPDARDTVVPQPGPGDPRDSDTRPALPPGVRDDATPQSAPASTGPTQPAPLVPEATRR
jgi:hypothetical protein